jgi:DNA (cytosine-5)-methyltransferase 1
MISLFTGAGGLDLGLHDAGFETRMTFEIDKWAHATLLANKERFNPHWFPMARDVTRFAPEQVLEATGLDVGETALIAGGPPCQSFSTAGRRGSLGDPRGGLFKNFADMIRVVRPRFFVMENVRGLLSAAIQHRPLAERGPDFPPLTPDEEQGSAFRVIRREFEEVCGYQLTYGLVDAADYGVPQNRLRVVILGSRDAEFTTTDLDQIVVPTHRGNWQTLRDAIGCMDPAIAEFLPYTAERERLMRLVPEGKNWRWFRDHPEYGAEFTERVMGGAWEADGGKVGFYRRLSWSKPSPTLPTSPIQKSTCLCHPVETRPLSVQEYAAIQQFPPEYKFAGGTGAKYKQIGNAVPVGLGRAIGEGLLGVMDKSESRGQLRLFEAAAAL